MSITLTLPEDNALILNAMSRALAEIAVNVAHGNKFEPTPEPFVSVKSHESAEYDSSKVTLRFEPSGVELTDKGATLNGKSVEHPESVGYEPSSVEVTNEGVECVPTVYEPEGNTPLPDTDKDGLPWDNRINSTPASVTASGVWKMRRKPKDMDDNQWAEYIETVRNELTNLMSIEVDDNADDTDTIEPIAGDSPVVDSVEVIEPVAPPVTPELVFAGHMEEQPMIENVFIDDTVEPVAPPLVTAVEPVAPPPAITTFPQLMTWLTGMTGKVTVEQVNGALAEWNMNSVALLAKRPDLIPAFITKIEELLK